MRGSHSVIGAGRLGRPRQFWQQASAAGWLR